MGGASGSTPPTAKAEAVPRKKHRGIPQILRHGHMATAPKKSWGAGKSPQKRHHRLWNFKFFFFNSLVHPRLTASCGVQHPNQRSAAHCRRGCHTSHKPALPGWGKASAGIQVLIPWPPGQSQHFEEDKRFLQNRIWLTQWNVNDSVYKLCIYNSIISKIYIYSIYIYMYVSYLHIFTVHLLDISHFKKPHAHLMKGKKHLQPSCAPPSHPVPTSGCRSMPQYVSSASCRSKRIVPISPRELGGRFWGKKNMGQKKIQFVMSYRMLNHFKGLAVPTWINNLHICFQTSHLSPSNPAAKRVSPGV